MTVQLAMYKGKGQLFNKLVRWWTGSIHSHCELVVGGVCYSSSLMDGGVRGKIIKLDDEKWDVLDIPWANSHDVLKYFNETFEVKYGVYSLITSQLFNRNKTSKKEQFCSEWCANALGLPNAVSMSPSTLFEWCKFMSSWGIGDE